MGMGVLDQREEKGRNMKALTFYAILTLAMLLIILVTATLKLDLTAGLGITAAVYLLMPYRTS